MLDRKGSKRRLRGLGKPCICVLFSLFLYFWFLVLIFGFGFGFGFCDGFVVKAIFIISED